MSGHPRPTPKGHKWSSLGPQRSHPEPQSKKRPEVASPAWTASPCRRPHSPARQASTPGQRCPQTPEAPSMALGCACPSCPQSARRASLSQPAPAGLSAALAHTLGVWSSHPAWVTWRCARDQGFLSCLPPLTLLDEDPGRCSGRCVTLRALRASTWAAPAVSSGQAQVLRDGGSRPADVRHRATPPWWHLL